MRSTLTRCLTAAAVAVALLVGAGGAPAQAEHARRLGYTQVTVAPGVYQLIASAGITAAPIDPAVAFPYRGTLAARFPITGYTWSSLTIKHRGGLTLSAGDATISLSSFHIELGRLRVSGAVAGSAVNAPRVALFRIRYSDRYDLGLVRLALTNVAAGALNTTFGVNAFSAGDTFGYATPNPLGALDPRLRAALRGR